MRAEMKSPIPLEDIAALRARAEASGPQTLSAAECLALLLRRGAGRAAPGWAERLLARFGSLPELLGASPAALQREAPPALALEIALLHDLQRRTLAAPLRARPVLADLSAVGDYLRTVLAAEGREQFRVLFLDTRQRLIRDEVMGEGSIDYAPAYPREVLRQRAGAECGGARAGAQSPFQRSQTP
jgi:DNA repair protein RadC